MEQHDEQPPMWEQPSAPAQSQMSFSDAGAEAVSTTSSWIEASRADRAEASEASERVERGETLAQAVPVYREAEPVAPAPAAMTPQRAPEASPVELPTVSLTLPEGSDLVLVETTHAAPAIEPEETESARPRRVRAARTKLPSEPLELVETRKDSPPAQ